MHLINKINMLLIGLVVIVNMIVHINPGGEGGGMGVYWVDNTKWKGPLNRRDHQRGPKWPRQWRLFFVLWLCMAVCRPDGQRERGRYFRRGVGRNTRWEPGPRSDPKSVVLGSKLKMADGALPGRGVRSLVCIQNTRYALSNSRGCFLSLCE